MVLLSLPLFSSRFFSLRCFPSGLTALASLRQAWYLAGPESFPAARRFAARLEGLEGVSADYYLHNNLNRPDADTLANRLFSPLSHLAH